MNPIGNLLKLFKKRTTQQSENDKRCLEGFNAFQKANDFFLKKRVQETLDCCDKAIDCGYVDDAEVYSMRGWCLQSLNYDLDAIEDFDRAIALQPEDSDFFFQRSISKGSTGDQHGRVSDLREAIRLAGIDNACTRSHDALAKEWGYENSAHFYEMQMVMAKDDLVFLEENSDPASSSYTYYQEFFKKKANMRRRPKVQRE